MREYKPQVRLPTDPEPNPYDSKTPFQKPLWMQFDFLFGIAALGALLVFLRLH